MLPGIHLCAWAPPVGGGGGLAQTPDPTDVQFEDGDRVAYQLCKCILAHMIAMSQTINVTVVLRQVRGDGVSLAVTLDGDAARG